MEYAARRARACAALAGGPLDALLVTDPLHVRYLTGLPSSNAALLLPTDDAPVLATDGRYAEVARRAAPDVELLVDRSAAAALLPRAAGGRVGLEEHVVTLAQHRRLREVPGARLEAVASPLLLQRAAKDDEEVAALRAAFTLADEAWTRLLPRVRPGITERELAVELEATMRTLGAEAPAFPTIVAAGEHGAEPHHVPCGRPLQTGDLVTVDWGARVDGYHSDCTRTVVLGEPTSAQQDLHALVAAAQAAGLAALAPGADAQAVDAAARAVVRDAGHDEHFPHGLGHGVGLEVHEAPWVGPTWPGSLAERATVTVEPGVYLPGRGGVRIEDTVVVRPDGPQVLTGTPRDLLVLG